MTRAIPPQPKMRSEIAGHLRAAESIDSCGAFWASSVNMAKPVEDDD